MEKRYQVFVSSTYADLKEERQKVIQALMEMDCIPSGMELFPAADEEQWAFIKRVIDDCDYYLLIIGGRYGSTNPEGISYTEKEYDYAIGKGIKVIALLHEKPDEIPVGKSEKDPELMNRLLAFREKVSKSRLVKYWLRADELAGLVALSLQKTIKTYPAVGWIRADRASNEDILNEINILRKENDKLKAFLQDYNRILTKYETKDLASLDEIYEVTGTYYSDGYKGSRKWSVQVSWRTIFKNIAPFMLKQSNAEITVSQVLKDSLFDKSAYHARSSYLDDQVLQTIKVQFMALGLINVQYLKTTAGDMALFWSLTPQGEELMFETRTIKTKSKEGKN